MKTIRMNTNFSTYINNICIPKSTMCGYYKPTNQYYYVEEVYQDVNLAKNKHYKEYTIYTCYRDEMKNPREYQGYKWRKEVVSNLYKPFTGLFSEIDVYCKNNGIKSLQAEYNPLEGLKMMFEICKGQAYHKSHAMKFWNGQNGASGASAKVKVYA